MSERKGINKYYPPDFDPSKVPKNKKKQGNQAIKVRLMAPFSMRCVKCNEYIAKSRKFNARKETTDEKYMNTKIFRFHITCPICNNPIVFKTNPQSAGYVTESGATKNFESKSQQVPVFETEEEILERLLKEEQENKQFQELKEKRKKNAFWQKNDKLTENGDITENLEKRLQEQQRQQEINDHLEYLQAKNSRLSSKGTTSQRIEQAQKRLTNDKNDTNGNDNDKDSTTTQEDQLIKQSFDKFNHVNTPSLTERKQESKPTLVMKKPKQNNTIKKVSPNLNLGYSSSDSEDD